MRVACFVHGRGAGHAARAREAVRELRERGHELHVFGGGKAAALLAGETGFRSMELCAPGRGMPAAFARRLGHDLGVLRALTPDVVISDGDAPSVHAAAALRLPRLAVGHGMLFHHARLPIAVPPRTRLYEWVNAGSSSWPCRRRVVVHFAPLEARTEGTVVARPDLREDLDAGAATEDFVLAYFRDDNGGPILRELVALGQRVIAFGRGAVPEGVELRPPSTSAFGDHLSRCKGVVASAGNHLPAEAVMLGKPMLSVYAAGDGEHEMNARLLEAAGFGLAGRLDRVDRALLERWLDFGAPSPEPLIAMKPASKAIADETEALGS